MPDNPEIIERIDSIITAVYRDRIQKPWDEGPLRAARYESIFRKRLSNWPLRNQTDLLYGSSTAIAFLLHPGYYIGVPTRDGIEVRIRQVGGQCFQSLLEISHLGQFARVRFTRETLDKETGRIKYEQQDKPYRDPDADFFFSLKKILNEEEIEILPRNILQHPVPDVELHVTKPGMATIYHCLFDEE